MIFNFKLGYAEEMLIKWICWYIDLTTLWRKIYCLIYLNILFSSFEDCGNFTLSNDHIILIEYFDS